MSTLPDTPPPCVPPRHKLATLTFLGLLAPVYVIPRALSAVFPRHPLLVLVLAVASIVALMTYVIMPALKRLFAAWLVPSVQDRT